METEESAGTGTGTGRGTHFTPRFDYVPPKNSADYQTKPLPAVPPRRSVTSSFSSQVDSVSEAPDGSLDDRQPGRDWERDADDVVNTWDNQMGPGQSPTLPEFDINNIPTTPPDDILSPQPKQCVQKILRLTGKTSPAASVSSPDSPTLHNSPQKIKQLTGLDVSMGGLSLSQLRSLRDLQDGVSPVSVSSSTHSREGLETTVSEPDVESSIYSYRYSHIEDDFNELVTPLSPPNFGASSRRPVSAAPVSPTSTPAAARLSGFRGGKDQEVPSQVGSSSLADNESQHGQGSGAESWTLSREGLSAGHFTDLYHDTTSEIARSSAAARSPPPAVEQRSIMWDNGPGEMPQESRLDLSSSPSLLPPASNDPRHKTGGFSDSRASSRNRAPPPLEPSREAPKPGQYNLPQRTPYPLPSSSTRSAFDSEDGRKRFSMLSKIFGGGGGSSSSSSKRDSSGSRGSSAPSLREHGGPVGTVEGPITPWSKPAAAAAAAAAVSGRPASAGPGILQRTMESARQSVGLKSKAEKRRQELRERIRIVGAEEMGANRQA